MVYRGAQNKVAVIIQEQKAYDWQREPICKNSLDLVRALIGEFSRDPLGAVWGRGEDNDRGPRGCHDRPG